jgi:hypothetical protein
MMPSATIEFRLNVKRVPKPWRLGSGSGLVWQSQPRDVRDTMHFRVVNLSTLDETEIKAVTPELAGQAALGEKLVRSGRPGDLRAKVYWHNSTLALTMCRLYALAERRQRQARH